MITPAEEIMLSAPVNETQGIIRTCRNCGVIPISDWKSTGSGLACRHCVRRVQRNNYHTHRDAKREKARRNEKKNRPARRKKNIVEVYALIDDMKRKPCTDCGIVRDPKCMDFDHVGKKTHGVSRLIQQGYSISFILTEIERTELVCVLCHRLRTYVRSSESAPSKPDNMNRKRARAYALREQKRAHVNELKLGSCFICNASYHPCQMDFDHIDPSTKLFAIADIVRGGHSFSVLKAELIKCRLACALCHRKSHMVM